MGADKDVGADTDADADMGDEMGTAGARVGMPLAKVLLWTSSPRSGSLRSRDEKGTGEADAGPEEGAPAATRATVAHSSEVVAE